MLTIHSSSNSEAAISYYTSELSRCEYYESEGSQGTWHGKAASLLGLSGEVAAKEFALLCKNRRPDTGGKLNPRDNETRRPGTDFTWSAPKSVSLVAMLVDQRIFKLFHRVVNETMALIESEAHVRVRKGGIVDSRRTGNLLWSEHMHFETRPHEDGRTCPQLHVHAYVQNTTYCEVEDRFKAVELFPAVRSADCYRAIFHSKLAEALKKIGYEIENKPFGFEIAGVGAENIKRFSRRSQEIEALAHQLGVSGDAAAMAKLGALTRHAKKKAANGGDKLTEWKSRMDWSEVNLKNPGRPQPTITAKEAVNLAIDDEFEQKSVSSLRKILAKALQNSLGDCSFEEIVAGIRANEELITRKVHGVTYATTKEILAEEKAILAFLKRTKSTQIPMLGWYRETSSVLDADQKAAVEAIMRTRDRAIFVSGKAGSGKTSMLKRLVEVMAEVGVEAHLFAPSSQAAHQVLKAEGFQDSETVQQLLVNPKLQAKIQGKSLIIDEAALLGTKDFLSLFRIAEEQDARVICVGDDAQHHPVQRGRSFRLCCESGLVTVKETRTIYRQRQASYKKAVTALSLGETGEALEILDEIGAIKEVGTLEDRLELISNEYLESLESNQDVLVVSPTHFEGRVVTKAIRDLLRSKERIGSEEMEIPVYRNRNLTVAQRSLTSFYQEGEVIRFHQNAKGGFVKSEVVRVVGKNENGVFVQKAGETTVRNLSLETVRHFNLFQETSMAVSIGDKVRITRNATSIEGKRLYNGNVHTITALSDDGHITLDRTVQVEARAGLLDWGYVSSSHASQGKTCSKVIVSQSAMSFDASSLEQLYVSVSRGRDAVTLVTDDREGLFEAVRDPSAQMLATELEKQILQEEEEYTQALSEQPGEEIQLH